MDKEPVRPSSSCPPGPPVRRKREEREQEGGLEERGWREGGVYLGVHLSGDCNSTVLVVGAAH